MKKSKILIPALAVMALGVGAASSGTVAWFTATQTLKKVTANASMDVKASTIDVGEITLKPSATDSGAVDLTDKSGNCWALVNTGGKYYYATATGSNKYGTLTLSVTATKGGGTAATADDLKPYVGSYTMVVTGGDRTRVSASNDSTVYSAGVKSSVNVTVTISAAGAISLSPSSVYYSVAGGDDSVTPVAGAEFSGTPDTVTTGVGSVALTWA